jgi:HlyD family secretion protein
MFRGRELGNEFFEHETILKTVGPQHKAEMDTGADSGNFPASPDVSQAKHLHFASENMANVRKFPWIKWLIILVLIGGGIGGGIWYFMNASASTPQYQLATVARGDLIQVVTATGQLNPVLNVQVGSQISGRISKIYVDYNSEVKSNQVIAEIDPSSYQVAVLRAEAEVANAKANLTLAQVQARRADTLYTNKLISASDHDTAVAQQQQAAAQVQSAEAAVANAKVDLSRCTIYAPVDGVVVSRNIDVGQTVAASFNTPTLFLIANDLSKMQIDALVSEADIGGVAVAQNVNFSVDAFPYRTFQGKVSQIRYGAITNQNVVNYDCVVEVHNEDLKLLPGMTATISIILAERNNAIRVSNAAFRFRPPEVVAAEATNQPARVASGASGGGGQAGGGFREGGGPGGGRSPGGGPRGGGGQGGGPGGGGGFRGPGAQGGGPAGAVSRPRPERSGPRTVYVVSGGNKNSPELTPVKVRAGITDGVNTEILEGLKEGDQVVTGLMAATSSSSGPRPTNPFGGGFRRF